MMCLLAVPFTPISGLLSDWVFGKVLPLPRKRYCDEHVSVCPLAYLENRMTKLRHVFCAR